MNLFLIRAQYNSYADSAHAAAVLKGFIRQNLSGNGLTDVTPLADLCSLRCVGLVARTAEGAAEGMARVSGASVERTRSPAVSTSGCVSKRSIR